MMPKFRAWDKKVKEMIEDVASIHFKTEMITTSNLYFYPFKDIELMKSTELTDKNGKEIFEGDIVKALSEGYCGTFQVKWRNEGTPMYILYPAWQNEQFWDLKGVNGVDDGIEVIGNIHEHPELLERDGE